MSARASKVARPVSVGARRRQRDVVVCLGGRVLRVFGGRENRKKVCDNFGYFRVFFGPKTRDKVEAFGFVCDFDAVRKWQPV